MINSVNIQPSKNINFKGIIKKSVQKYTASGQIGFITLPKEVYSINDIQIQYLNKNTKYADFIKRKGMVTLEEYYDIKENHPEIILRAIKHIENEAKNNEFNVTPDKAAKLIKMLDFFVEDNSKVIAIGTSPSFIAEGMKALGKDIVFIPMSGGNWCIGKSTIKDYFEYYPNFKLVGEYLKHQGITPENLKGQDVIILDFCATGKTMQMMERLVKEYCKIDEDKVYTENLYNLIKTGFWQSKKKNILKADDIEDIRESLMYQKVEIASNVPHFSIYSDKNNKNKPYSISSKGKSKEKLFKEFKEYSRPAARAYQLCVLHELDLLGELKKLKKVSQNEN